MNVYFSATITEDKKSKDNYKEIINILKTEGHKVLEYDQDKLSPRELLNRTDDDIKKAYKLLSQNMKSSDVYIADITYPSVGIGYEISEAISERKPVLVLSHKNSDFSPLATIQGNRSKLINYQQYTKESLKQILGDFLDDAKSKLDTKFILIISPEIDKYLKWSADERRMHKAQIVRDAIENMMSKDKEYKDYLKSVNG